MDEKERPRARAQRYHFYRNVKNKSEAKRLKMIFYASRRRLYIYNFRFVYAIRAAGWNALVGLQS